MKTGFLRSVLFTFSLGICAVAQASADDFSVELLKPTPLVYQIGVHKWDSAAKILDKNINIQSVLVQQNFDDMDIVTWEFVLIRDDNGNYREYTYYYGTLVSNKPYA